MAIGSECWYLVVLLCVGDDPSKFGVSMQLCIDVLLIVVCLTFCSKPTRVLVYACCMLDVLLQAYPGVSV